MRTGPPTSGSTGALEQLTAYYPFGGVITDLGTKQTSGQPYRFGGKELITANGLNEYDFGARQYYSAVPGFSKPDPCCEGFYHLSPYLFCGNDPVNNIDPTGMVFTETSQEYIDNFVSSIESRIRGNNDAIAEKKSQLNNGGISSRKADRIHKSISKLERSNTSLEEVKDEITALQESTQVYNIYRDDCFNTADPYGLSIEIGSGVRYNEETDMFDIILGDDSFGMLAHELKHAYQFETGDFSSGYNKTGSPFYDQTDEIEAYARGAMFGQPKNNDFQKKYGMFQKDASGVRYLNEIIQNSPRALQNIANKTKSIFRWNGITYKYKK